MSSTPQQSLPVSKTLLLWVILGSGAVLTLLPFWVMLVTSVLPAQEVFSIPPTLWTWTPDWRSWPELFARLPFGRYFWNSLVVAGIVTAVHTLLSAMAAFGFARMPLKHKNLWFFLFLMTLMIPPQVNLVPLFFMMKTFGWLDSWAALIVPGCFGAFGVFLLRQWFLDFPKALEEAAILDGCSPWQLFWHVALPMARPSLVALALFVFITQWNSFIWPLIVTFSEEMRTLPVGIAALKGSFRDTTDWPLLMAGAAVSILPVLIVFLLAQKQFIAGITQGAVKE